MLALAFDGVTSLSVKPIRLITGFGLLISLLSFLLIIWVLISYFTGNSVPGWSSTVLSTALLGGIQLICLGVIGEYVGKIYMETKRRPRYIIAERTEEKGESSFFATEKSQETPRRESYDNNRLSHSSDNEGNDHYDLDE